MRIRAQRPVVVAGITVALLSVAACGSLTGGTPATAGAVVTAETNPLEGESLCFLTADEQKQLGVANPQEDDGSCTYSNPSNFSFSLGDIAFGLSGLETEESVTHLSIGRHPAIYWSMVTNLGDKTCTVAMQLTPNASLEIYAWHAPESGPGPLIDSCPFALQTATIVEKRLP